MHIGFIGLGNMGSAMAANLLAAGHDVTAYNRSRDKVDALAARGARPAESVAEACRADAVVTMLAHDEAVNAVTFGDDGILASLPDGAVHVSASTISVALAGRLAAEHTAAGQRFVSAPVFGRPAVAEAGQLYVVAAGAPDAVGDMAPVFDAVGQRTFILGDDPTAANLVKLSGNFLIASVIESVGEAITLVSKGGVDAGQYLELLTSTLFDAPVYRTYGGLVARREFEPAGFAATGGLKDVRLVLEAGEALRVPLPVASLIRDRFLTLLATGGGDLDWSAIGALSAWEAGAAGPATSGPGAAGPATSGSASDHPA